MESRLKYNKDLEIPKLEVVIRLPHSANRSKAGTKPTVFCVYLVWFSFELCRYLDIISDSELTGNTTSLCQTSCNHNNDWDSIENPNRSESASTFDLLTFDKNMNSQRFLKDSPMLTSGPTDAILRVSNAWRKTSQSNR